MPIYEYRCGACGHELEVLQKLSEPPLSDCPECKAPALAKLISPVGFQLKGSGWYATDFKGSGKPAGKTDGKNGDGAAKPAAASEAKSDSGSAKTETTGASGGGCGGNCSCH